MKFEGVQEKNNKDTDPNMFRRLLKNICYSICLVIRITNKFSWNDTRAFLQRSL